MGSGPGLQELISVMLRDATINSKAPQGWHKFITHIGDAGSIITKEYLPIIYLNGVQVDNKTHQMTRQAVSIIKSTTTTTSGGGGK